MGKKKTDRQFWESASMNNVTFRHYYDRLTELAISMFEWVNLPDTVDPRFMELALFNYGSAVYFKDDVMGDLVLRVAMAGGFDEYEIPKKRRAYASNGYSNDLDETNSVIIFNNYLHQPSRYYIEMFAKRLYNLDRAIDVNANAQKTPVLVLCDEQQRLTMLNAYKAYEGNEPFIFGNQGMNAKGFTVLKTDAPYVCDRLYQLKTQIWNEALTYLGISNLNTTKKERMVTDEVLRNQGGTIASRYSRLEARRQAAEKINKMFGTNIEVNYREDYREADDEIMFAGDTGDGSANPMVIDVRTN